MRSITEQGLQLIKQFESFSPTIYLCPARVPTIGYGRVVKKHEMAKFKVGIDHAIALELLKEDVKQAERAVLSLIRVPLTDGQFSALVSFCFNLGSGALQRSTLRCVVNRAEHDRVPRELAKWVWAGGRKLRGLILRRAAESALYQH